MDKNRHEKDIMSKGAAQEVSDTENNEENQHEAGGWMGHKKRLRLWTKPLKEYGSYLLSRIVVQYHRP
jgi:hypothetical protein